MQDVEDALQRMKASSNPDGSVYFAGWARMAQPITEFKLVEVGRPKLGQLKPSSVRADIKIHLNVRFALFFALQGD